MPRVLRPVPYGEEAPGLEWEATLGTEEVAYMELQEEVRAVRLLRLKMPGEPEDKFKVILREEERLAERLASQELRELRMRQIKEVAEVKAAEAAEVQQPELAAMEETEELLVAEEAEAERTRTQETAQELEGMERLVGLQLLLYFNDNS